MRLRKRHGPVLAALLAGIIPPAALASTPEQMLAASCGACHADAADPGGPLTRMGGQRKTPEGWEMTIFRMEHLHKAVLTGPDGESPDEVRRALVRHLADTRGLAPAESARYRYILERRLNTIDKPADAEYAVMCARCHSAARVGLQRRSEEEWRHLVHFHVAQFPTVEYSAGGRDRDWLGTALDRMVPMLAAEYPLESQAWTEWQAAAKPALDGRWRLFGGMPGKGAFEGVMSSSAGDAGNYSLELSGRFADGTALAGAGKAVVYTGYEWRASLDAAGTGYRQILAANADGSELQGRMVLAALDESGIDIRAVRDDGRPRVLGVYPQQLRAGASAEVTIVGTGLAGTPDFGPGLQVSEIRRNGSDSITARLTATADAAPGARRLALGKTALDAALVVYSQIDRIEVSPGYAVARVGGSEGSQPAVPAAFEAIAFANGADGQPGTADDLRIGAVPASWSVAPWDDKAASDGDVKFSGTMDSANGVFHPAAAGPNPERKYGTNNAGNLKVLAQLKDGERELGAEGRLLVTVQRWNNPPIR